MTGRPRGRPFPSRHLASVKHGAYSPRRVEPLARQLVDEIVATVDYLGRDASFGASVWAWARAEAKVQLLDEWLQEHGVIDDAGRVHPALNALATFERLAAEHRRALGLDPSSRVKLAAHLAAAESSDAYERLLQHGREIATQRQAELQAAQDAPEGPQSDAGTVAAVEIPASNPGEGNE